jgi:tRNA nucleotidyltransferase (CCA-adding enzyme)
MEQLIKFCHFLNTYENLEFYFVGGCVRDEILKQTTNDIDVCIVGGKSFNDVKRIFEDALKMGVIDGFTPVENDFPILIVEIEKVKYEFAMARIERATGATHQDFEMDISNVTIQEDLKRRDFTCNAIAKNVLTGEVIDPYLGEFDMSISMLHPVSRAFLEDPVRVIRGCRFAARFGFDFSITFNHYARELKSKQHTIPREMIGKELKSALKYPNAGEFIRNLDNIGWLEFAFPEVYALKGVRQDAIHHPEGDVLTHTILVMNAAPDEFTRLAALCHDLGKATKTEITIKEDGNEKITSIGHEEAGVEIAKAMLKRITLGDHKLRRQIGVLTKWHMVRINLSETNIKRCLRDLESVGLVYEDLIKLCFADANGRGLGFTVPVDMREEYADAVIKTKLHRPIVNGDMILKEFPQLKKEKIGIVLDKCLEWQDRGTLNSGNWQKLVKQYKI